MGNDHAESRLDDPRCAAYAHALYEAYRTHVPIPPLTDHDPELGAAEGYAIQQRFVDLLLNDGESLVGYKLGLTSSAMQTLLGVYQPDFGPIFASKVSSSPGEIAFGQFIAPRIEAEIGLVLGSDLTGPDCTIADVRAAAAGAFAALEVADSRILDWRITIADTIADLASGAAVVRSDTLVPITDWEPRLTGTIFTVNGTITATGAGGAALGDPLAAVAWLANALAPTGASLRAGQIIVTGAICALLSVNPGDHVRAEFDRLGAVEAVITR